MVIKVSKYFSCIFPPSAFAFLQLFSLDLTPFSSRNLVLHNLVFTAFEFPANSFPTTESDYVRKFYFHNYSNKSA